jgi:MFS family permease
MSLDESSTRMLAVTVSIFFFTTSLSGTFLPIYFNEALSMGVSDIVVILLFTFVTIGLIPLLLIRITRRFERIISLGIILTLLFYVALIYVKSPIILGLAYGVSLATFWPSFNLLQFRLSETRERALLISLMSVAIPGIAGIVSPAIGGFIIEQYGFVYLYTVSIILFLSSFAVSLKIRYKPERENFLIPKNTAFRIFMLTFVLLGLGESYWLAYPFFVLSISSTIVSMGLVITASSLIITLLNIGINRLSDIKGSRVEFAIVSSILYAAWYLALAFTWSTIQIVFLSVLSGLAAAFAISWFAYYGDSFGREYHASILVMMEVGLMAGRIINLIPTYIFISSRNYASYFGTLATASLLPMPLYILCARHVNKNSSNQLGHETVWSTS